MTALSPALFIERGKEMFTIEQKEEIIKLRSTGIGSRLIAKNIGAKRDAVRNFLQSKTALQIAENLDVKVDSLTYQKKPLKKRYCKECGVEYRFVIGGLNSQIYCSLECKKQSALRRKKETIKIKTYLCDRCGKEFVRNGNQVYCSDKCKYITKHCVICGVEFTTHFKTNSDCCSNKCSGYLRAKTHEAYYMEFSKIHKGKIVPITFYVSGKHDMTVHCLQCGKQTTRRAEWFASKNKQFGCAHCGKKSSTGEKVIQDWLDDNDIKYKKQHKFDGFIDVKELRYDFAILNDLNEVKMLIEYNGRQHYEPVEQFGGVVEFERQQRSDNIKRQYALDNGIRLIEISYKQKDHVEDILSTTIGIPPFTL